MSRIDSAVVVDPRGERLPLAAVIVLVFAISWLSTIPQIWASWEGAAAVPGWAKALQVFLVAPGLVALAAAAINGGRAAFLDLLKRLFRWRASPWTYVGALLGPPAVMLSSIVISNALGATAIALPAPGDAFAAFVPTFLVYVLLNDEELAWRGYVLRRFQWRWSPLTASLVLGVIWTAFHSPYFLMKGGHPGGFSPLLFFATLLPVAILQTRFFNATAGSVLLPHLFHQSINAWAEALPVLPRFAHSATPEIIAAMLYGVAAIIAIVMPVPMTRHRGAASG